MFAAYSPDYDGIFVHSSENDKEVSWFPPRWTCDDLNNFYSNGGDAMLLGIFQDNKNGAWCDAGSFLMRKFICEANI